MLIETCLIYKLYTLEQKFYKPKWFPDKKTLSNQIRRKMYNVVIKHIFEMEFELFNLDKQRCMLKVQYKIVCRETYVIQFKNA